MLPLQLVGKNPLQEGFFQLQVVPGITWLLIASFLQSLPWSSHGLPHFVTHGLLRSAVFIRLGPTLIQQISSSLDYICNDSTSKWGHIHTHPKLLFGRQYSTHNIHRYRTNRKHLSGHREDISDRKTIIKSGSGRLVTPWCLCWKRSNAETWVLLPHASLSSAPFFPCVKTYDTSVYLLRAYRQGVLVVAQQ